jgi:hypothetical protein
MAAGTRRSNLQTDAARCHSLHRKVELSRCAAKAFEQFGVDCHAASPRKPTTMAVHEKHQVFIHQQSQPSTAQRPSGYRSPSIEQVRT